MNHLIEIGSIFFKSLFSIIKAPIFWILIFILYLQYNKIGKFERKVLGANKQSVYKRIVYSTLSGILGGILGSVVMLMLGVTIEVDDFVLIFFIAILLMFINSRFLCFSYAGGIVSLVSLFFGYPNINVSSIMAIVAVLHLVESFLIMSDGYKTRIPMFLDKDGMTIGGFNMIRYWPLPFVILMTSNQAIANSGIYMPNWWPLFASEGMLIDKDSLTYVMGGVIAALGYGDMTFTEYPKDKARQSSIQLFFYSVILLFLAVLSSRLYIVKIIAVLFAPIGHEFLIHYSRRKEKSRKPIFTSVDNGVRILETKPNGIAEKMGVKMGDIILSINGLRIESIDQIRAILINIPSYIWIDYYNKKGELKSSDYCDYNNGIRDLGILVVPRYSPYVFDIDERQSLIIKAYKWIKRKLDI